MSLTDNQVQSIANSIIELDSQIASLKTVLMIAIRILNENDPILVQRTIDMIPTYQSVSDMFPRSDFSALDDIPNKRLEAYKISIEKFKDELSSFLK